MSQNRSVIWSKRAKLYLMNCLKLASSRSSETNGKSYESSSYLLSIEVGSIEAGSSDRNLVEYPPSEFAWWHRQYQG